MGGCLDMQRRPFEQNAAVTADPVAKSKSVSRSTATGFLPPISH